MGDHVVELANLGRIVLQSVADVIRRNGLIEYGHPHRGDVTRRYGDFVTDSTLARIFGREGFSLSCLSVHGPKARLVSITANSF